jgi:hypothetical protein
MEFTAMLQPLLNMVGNAAAAPEASPSQSYASIPVTPVTPATPPPAPIPAPAQNGSLPAPPSAPPDPAAE